MPFAISYGKKIVYKRLLKNDRKYHAERSIQQWLGINSLLLADCAPRSARSG